MTVFPFYYNKDNDLPYLLQTRILNVLLRKTGMDCQFLFIDF